MLCLAELCAPQALVERHRKCLLQQMMLTAACVCSRTAMIDNGCSHSVASLLQAPSADILDPCCSSIYID